MNYIPAKSIISGYRESNDWFRINYNMNIYIKVVIMDVYIEIVEVSVMV